MNVDLEFLVTVAEPAGDSRRLEFLVDVEPASASALEQEFDVTVDNDLLDAARPRALGAGNARVQMVGWRILVNGQVALTSSSERSDWNVSDFSVDMDFEGTTASISIAAGETWVVDGEGIKYKPSKNPWGNSLPDAQPSGGKATISIEGLYATDSGLQYVPLMTNGIVDNSQRRIGSEGAVDSINFVDAMGRYDHAPVYLEFPPGHNMRRDQVVTWMGQGAFYPTFNLNGTQRTIKEIILTKEDSWIELGRELMEVEGRALLPDRRGHLWNPLMLPKGALFTNGPTMQFDSRDLLCDSYSSDHSSEVPTRVCLTGVRQLPCDQIGRYSVQVVTETVGGRTTKTPTHSVTLTTGAATAIPGGGVETLRNELIERRTVTTEYDCDTVISETICIEGWFNPLAARTFQGTGPGPSTTVYLFDGGGTDVPAYRWPTERFTTISSTKTTHQYDPDTGIKTGEIVCRSAWYNPECAIKERSSSSDDWETEPDLFQLLEHSGRAVDLVGQVYIGEDCNGAVHVNSYSPGTDPCFERDTHTILNSGGYQTRETIITQGFRRDKGQLFLYGDGNTAGAECEDWGQKERKEVSYLNVDESTHRSITQVYDSDNRPVGPPTIVTGVGYLPAQAAIVGIVPDDSFFEQAPEFANNAQAASREQTQQLLASASSAALEANHAESEWRGRNVWARDSLELQQVAYDLLRIGAAIDVEFDLPANFTLEVGQYIHVSLPMADLEHDMLISRLSHSQKTPCDPIVTTVNAKIFHL